MPTTSKGLRYPSSSAAPNVPQDIQNLASDVETRLSLNLGSGHLASPVVLAQTPTYTDIATVTATSTGGVCEATFILTAYNANSGLDRTMDVRVTVDGSSIGSFTSITVPLANLRPVTRTATFTSTPTAGSHTWKLQATAGNAASVQVETGHLHVEQR